MKRGKEKFKNHSSENLNAVSTVMKPSDTPTGSSGGGEGSGGVGNEQIQWQQPQQKKEGEKKGVKKRVDKLREAIVKKHKPPKLFELYQQLRGQIILHIQYSDLFCLALPLQCFL